MSIVCLRRTGSKVLLRNTGRSLALDATTATSSPRRIAFPRLSLRTRSGRGWLGLDLHMDLGALLLLVRLHLSLNSLLPRTLIPLRQRTQKLILERPLLRQQGRSCTNGRSHILGRHLAGVAFRLASDR